MYSIQARETEFESLTATSKCRWKQKQKQKQAYDCYSKAELGDKPSSRICLTDYLRGKVTGLVGEPVSQKIWCQLIEEARWQTHWSLASHAAWGKTTAYTHVLSLDRSLSLSISPSLLLPPSPSLCLSPSVSPPPFLVCLVIHDKQLHQRGVIYCLPKQINSLTLLKG